MAGVILEKAKGGGDVDGDGSRRDEALDPGGPLTAICGDRSSEID